MCVGTCTCAKLSTSPPGLKESPDGSPGQLGSGGVWRARHHHPLQKPGLSGQEGAPAVLASWDLGCLGRGQAPSSDVGLEATHKLPEKLPPAGPLSLWMSHPPALSHRKTGEKEACQRPQELPRRAGRAAASLGPGTWSGRHAALGSLQAAFQTGEAEICLHCPGEGGGGRLESLVSNLSDCGISWWRSTRSKHPFLLVQCKPELKSPSLSFLTQPREWLGHVREDNFPQKWGLKPL